MAHLGSILALSWPILAPSWLHLGPVWAHLGPSGYHLGPSGTTFFGNFSWWRTCPPEFFFRIIFCCFHLAQSCPILAQLGSVLAPSWPILVILANLAPSWPTLASSFLAHLASSWPILASSWPLGGHGFLASTWPHLGPPWPHLSWPTCPHLGPSWPHLGLSGTTFFLAISTLDGINKRKFGFKSKFKDYCCQHLSKTEQQTDL